MRFVASPLVIQIKSNLPKTLDYQRVVLTSVPHQHALGCSRYKMVVFPKTVKSRTHFHSSPALIVPTTDTTHTVPTVLLTLGAKSTSQNQKQKQTAEGVQGVRAPPIDAEDAIAWLKEQGFDTQGPAKHWPSVGDFHNTVRSLLS